MLLDFLLINKIYFLNKKILKIKISYFKENFMEISKEQQEELKKSLNIFMLNLVIEQEKQIDNLKKIMKK